MLGADMHPRMVQDYLQNELQAGCIVPIPPSWCANVDLSRFGVILKKRQPGKWRLIVNLLSPDRANVNFIACTCSLQYASVDDTADFVARSGRGTLLAKLDIKRAYTNIPVHPRDRHLLRVQWQGTVFVDACLPLVYGRLRRYSMPQPMHWNGLLLVKGYVSFVWSS